MTATKVKYEPRYKAGDWIVVEAGYGSHRQEHVMRTRFVDNRSAGLRYLRHATDEEVAVKETQNEAAQQVRTEFEARCNSQPYKDANSILCLDAETLIDKLGPLMLREIAKKLR